MSLAGFQRAYADLAASARLCLAVRANAGEALAAYELTTRERQRLERAVWQRGMNANCTIYRATRITALNAVVPITLRRIGPDLRAVLDAYWEDHPVHDTSFAREAARFIAWLERHTEALHEAGEEIVAFARGELTLDEKRLSGR